MREIARIFASGGAALLALWMVAGPASATTTFNVFLDGSQEVGGGDPSGSASGTLTLDDVNDTISWDITYSGLGLPPSTIYPITLIGWHIHGPGGSAGNNAVILIDLGDVSSGPIPNGTLIGVDLAASSADIDSILANPGDFYLNLHTSDGFGGIFEGFPAGAIRGQVPEPNSFLILALGFAALVRWRR